MFSRGTAAPKKPAEPPPPSGKIFINYRRSDDPGTALALFGHLEREFAREQLFMDVEGHIKGGDDFVVVLREQVTACDVLLAMIGPRWLTLTDENGRQRLDNPDDWVRVEIASALEDEKRIIPVLYGGAGMPHVEDLPEPLKPLARKQAVRLTVERFKADATGLIAQIRSVLDDVEQAKRAKTEAERRVAAEAERKRLEEEREREAERARQEAERLRMQTIANLNPDEIRKAEELANWKFVEGRDSQEEIRDHLARYAGGLTERYALAKLEETMWGEIQSSPSISMLEAFLDEFPHSQRAAKASEQLSILEREERARQDEEIEWHLLGGDKPEHLEAFLEKYPNGRFSAEAQEKLQRLRPGRDRDVERQDLESARDEDTTDALRAYVAKYPDGKWRTDAERSLEGLQDQMLPPWSMPVVWYFTAFPAALLVGAVGSGVELFSPEGSFLFVVLHVLVSSVVVWVAKRKLDQCRNQSLLKPMRARRWCLAANIVGMYTIYWLFIIVVLASLGMIVKSLPPDTQAYLKTLPNEFEQILNQLKADERPLMKAIGVIVGLGVPGALIALGFVALGWTVKILGPPTERLRRKL